MAPSGCAWPETDMSISSKTSFNLRAFISPTFSDLEEYRQAAFEAIQSLGAGQAQAVHLERAITPVIAASHQTHDLAPISKRWRLSGKSPQFTRRQAQYSPRPTDPFRVS
jgi:hypothetical protein